MTLLACATCKGAGYILVTGGAPDEKIPERCPECRDHDR